MPWPFKQPAQTDNPAPPETSDTPARVDPVYPLALEAEVIEALREVYDPEIPVNIYEMGLVYDVSADDTGKVDIVMTLTSPACPVAGSLPGEVEAAAKRVPGVTKANVELTWEPPWTMDRMSEEAKLELGLM